MLETHKNTCNYNDNNIVLCLNDRSMEQKPVFQTFALSKYYKEFKAVDAVNMTIYEGDIYGFVGENGAGKTTLIRLACNLIHPSGGEYSLFGVSSNNPEIKEERKKTAAIVEAVAVNRGLSAVDNLREQCLLAGINKSDEELNKLLKDVGLDVAQIQKKKVGSFSLGMRQRLGLAIALISNPKFVMLDEPMNGLDPQGFVDMRETILRLNKQGVTFLISSHILSELDKICTRVGFLSHGRLLKEISFAELHDLARRKIVIRVKDSEKVKDELVKQFNAQEVKLEGEFITIYDRIDINEVMQYLTSKHILVKGISCSEETIEDYYRQLMNNGGGH